MEEAEAEANASMTRNLRSARARAHRNGDRSVHFHGHRDPLVLARPGRAQLADALRRQRGAPSQPTRHQNRERALQALLGAPASQCLLRRPRRRRDAARAGRRARAAAAGGARAPARHGRRNLLALPDELLLRCLVTASLADLAAAARTCRGLRDAAHTGCLWLRHCSRRFWRESRGVADQLGRESWAALSPIRGAPLGPPLPAPSAAPAAVDRHALEAAVDWRLVCRAERLWADLKARAGRSGTVGLRAGLPLHALLALPADVRSRLPPELRASMLVHDGEETTAGAGGGVEVRPLVWRRAAAAGGGDGRRVARAGAARRCRSRPAKASNSSPWQRTDA